jgi:hypothetical protein
MVINLAAGLDDTATMTQQCAGWSYIVMDSTARAQFEAQAVALLPAGIREFHGKKWKPAQSTAYKQFLELVRRSLEADPASRAASSLNTVGWNDQFVPFCQKVVEEFCRAHKIAEKSLVAAMRQLFPPLITFQRLLRDCQTGATISFQIDTNDTLAQFPGLRSVIDGQVVTAESILATLYERYRVWRFPSAPSLTTTGVTICRGSMSSLVQAADVIGNFSLAYVYDKAGQATARVAQKAQIFLDVFGDIIDDAALAECEFINGELSLKQEGALTFTIKC